jgi:hypothetical protein
MGRLAQPRPTYLQHVDTATAATASFGARCVFSWATLATRWNTPIATRSRVNMPRKKLISLFLLIFTLLVLFYLIWIIGRGYPFELAFRTQDGIYRNA